MPENDIQSAISKLLADPEALSGIMSMASGLMSAAPKASQDADTESDSATDSADISAALREMPDTKGGDGGSGGLPDLSALAGLLGAQKKNDPRCSLLYALRPYMSRERAERIDSLVNALRLAELASGILKNGGLF